MAPRALVLSLCHRYSIASILSRNSWVFCGGGAGVRELSSGERYHLAEAAFALYVTRWPRKIKRNPRNRNSMTTYEDVTMLSAFIILGLAAEPGGPTIPHRNHEANIRKP